jgi:methionine sulfoxide reductase heme-binding subunit
MNTRTYSIVLGNSLKVFGYSLWVLFGISILTYTADIWGSLGAVAGRFSIVLLWLALLPGILSRFRVTGYLEQLRLILRPSRRWIGICMFVCALLHVAWTKWFYIAQFGYPGPDDIKLYEVFGLLAFYLCVPLFITSNDFAVRFLKRWWGRLHSIIYGIMILVTLHVSLQGPKNMIIFGVPSAAIFLLIIASFINLRGKKSS